MTDENFFNALQIVVNQRPVLQSYRNRLILQSVSKGLKDFVHSNKQCRLSMKQFPSLVGNQYAGFEWVPSHFAVCCGKLFAVVDEGRILLRRIDEIDGAPWSPVVILPGANNIEKWKESSVEFSRVDMMFCFELSTEKHSTSDRITQIVSSKDHLIIKINDEEKSITHLYRYFAGTRRRCKKRLDAWMILPFVVSRMRTDTTRANDEVLVSPSHVIYYQETKSDESVHVHAFGDEVVSASKVLSIDPRPNKQSIIEPVYRFKWVSTGDIFTVYHVTENENNLRHLIKIPVDEKGYWFEIPASVTSFTDFKPMYCWTFTGGKKWPEFKDIFEACPGTLNILTKLKAVGWTRPHWPATSFISKVNGRTKFLDGDLISEFNPTAQVLEAGSVENNAINGVEKAVDTCDLDKRVLIRGDKFTSMHLGKQTIVVLEQDPSIEYHVDWESDIIYTMHI